MRKADLLFADPFFSVLKIEKQIASKCPVGKIHLSLYEKYYIIAHNVCNGVHVYIRKKGKKSVSMKKLFEKWNSISLILRIVCGLVIGVILGLVVPQATRYCHSGRCFL